MKFTTTNRAAVFSRERENVAAAAGLLTATLLLAAPAVHAAGTNSEARAYRQTLRMERIARSPHVRGTAAAGTRRNMSRNASKENKSASRTGAGAHATSSELHRALDQIGLSPEQRDQIAALDRKADADGQTAYNDRTLSPAQFDDRMDQINTDHRRAIEDVLTPTQRSRFQSLVK